MGRREVDGWGNECLSCLGKDLKGGREVKEEKRMDGEMNASLSCSFILQVAAPSAAQIHLIRRLTHQTH